MGVKVKKMGFAPRFGFAIFLSHPNFTHMIRTYNSWYLQFLAVSRNIASPEHVLFISYLHVKMRAVAVITGLQARRQGSQRTQLRPPREQYGELYFLLERLNFVILQLKIQNFSRLRRLSAPQGQHFYHNS